MLLFDNFFKTVLQQVCHFEVDVIAGDANAATCKYDKNQECQDLYDSSVAVMLKEMQREVNTGHSLESRLHIDYPTNNDPPQFYAADGLDCCFMAILGPRIMRKLWSNITTGQPENSREQTDDNKGKQTEDNSRERGAKGGAAGLHRGRRRSHGGTSRL